MKLSSSFPVPAAPDKVLTLFLDPQTMQACIPGCEELVQVDDTHYRGSLVNEVAHVKFKAGFTAEITSLTAPADTSQPSVVTAVLKGEDRRLGSTIRVEATLTVSPEAGSPTGAAVVAYDFELAMWGKLGRLGESVIRRRTMEVEKQFAEALTAVCSGQPVPAPVDKAAERRKRRAAHDDAPVAGVAHQSVTAPTETVPALPTAARSHPDPDRPREDWAVLGLAVAAAFAYGIIFGGRRRTVRA
jgi:carbon monoxide dehydrogenase subunit G